MDCTQSSASSFRASLLQEIDAVMSLALCPQLVSQKLQHLRSFETQATCEGCFARQSICSVVSLHSGMSRQYTHISFRSWMSTINTVQSGLPIPLFIFCSKLIESGRMTACDPAEGMGDCLGYAQRSMGTVSCTNIGTV